MDSQASKIVGVIINYTSLGMDGASKTILCNNKLISQSSNAVYANDGILMYNFTVRGLYFSA